MNKAVKEHSTPRPLRRLRLRQPAFTFLHHPATPLAFPVNNGALPLVGGII